MQRFAFFAQLKAKPGKEEELERFIEQGDAHMRDDANIIHSFSMMGADTVYYLFDTFETETARAEHLSGEAAAKLASVTDSLLREPPSVQLLEIVRLK